MYNNVPAMSCPPINNYQSADHSTFELLLKAVHIFHINFNTGKMQSFLLDSVFQLSTAHNAFHQLGRLC